MTDTPFPLAEDRADDETVEVDAQWKALLARLKAVVPERKISEAARQMGGMTPNYLHALLTGTKKNPSFEKRERIEKWVSAQEQLRELIRERTLPVDTSGKAEHTAASLPSPASQPIRLEDRFVPTPSHAALIELLSLLPAPIILEMIPDVARKVADRLNEPVPPEKKTD